MALHSQAMYRNAGSPTEHPATHSRSSGRKRSKSLGFEADEDPFETMRDVMKESAADWREAGAGDRLPYVQRRAQWVDEKVAEQKGEEGTLAR